MKTGKFITLEGIEGAGKTTALNFLTTELNTQHVPFITTREPGGTEVAEAIRRILLHHETETLCPETELLLMFAARCQHLEHVIRPALSKGQWVLCDRFIDASFAYQGGGRGIDEKIITTLQNFTMHDIKPDLTILLDISPEVGLARAKARNAQWDRFEQEQVDFFKHVREAYLQRAALEPERFCVIDAYRSLHEIQQDLRKAINL